MENEKMNNPDEEILKEIQKTFENSVPKQVSPEENEKKDCFVHDYRGYLHLRR